MKRTDVVAGLAGLVFALGLGVALAWAEALELPLALACELGEAAACLM